MNIFKCIKKVLQYPNENILLMSASQFYEKMDMYDFNYEEFVIVMGILLNRDVVNKTKQELNLSSQEYEAAVIIDFAVFAYIFIGDEYNDKEQLSNLRIELEETYQNLFISTLEMLINNYTRTFVLFHVLGSDNDRANMFAVNAILNIKKGIGFDNFHITLFMVYQSLELKLKHCLKKYIELEPTAYKKQFNFHNLVRLIKLISTSKVTDDELANILSELREDLRYFEKINPGGQAARYEAEPNKSYFNDNSILIINEKDFLFNFVHALNLLQKLYLKLIELYYPNQKGSNQPKNSKKIDPGLVRLFGITDVDNCDLGLQEKLRNILDQQIFGDCQELMNLSYQELLILRFLIRIGFIQYVNKAVDQLLS